MTITATKNGVAATSPVTATVGDTVVLTATVTNAASCKTLTYQWYNNSGAIVGATGNTYTVPSTAAAAANDYWCLATNADDTKSGTKIATTAPANVTAVKVTVNAAAVAVTPTDATYTSGKITFTTAESAGVINAKLYQVNGGSMVEIDSKALTVSTTSTDWNCGILSAGQQYKVVVGEFSKLIVG